MRTAAKFEPGPTLGGRLTETNKNPQLRVEAQVYVPVNDESAADFIDLTALAAVNGFHQAVNIPTDTGIPIKYAGSTTGPGCNEKSSPIQVNGLVRPNVKKVNIPRVAKRLKSNPFNGHHAHGVRALVTKSKLLPSFDQ